MRFSVWIGVLVAACSSTPDHPPASGKPASKRAASAALGAPVPSAATKPVAPPSTSPPPTSELSGVVVSCDDASSRIAALPEVKEMLAAVSNKVRCSGKYPRYAVSVGQSEGDAFELVFEVAATSGEIGVDADKHARFSRGRLLKLDEWREERQARNTAAKNAYELPEIKGWQKGLRAMNLDLGFWLESEPPSPSCKAGESDCQWSFYVGEVHPTHSVRRISVIIDRKSGAVSIANLGGEVFPYEKWRKTQSAALMRAGK